MSLINMISEIIMEEKKFKKKYEVLIFLKEIEDHIINLMNIELSDSDGDSSETNESDITDEEYEIDKETEHGIDFFMLK